MADRDRVTAILTLADNGASFLTAVPRTETVWLAEWALEALDTIDSLTKQLEVSENVATH